MIAQYQTFKNYFPVTVFKYVDSFFIFSYQFP
jgi:hypothetical protein